MIKQVIYSDRNVVLRPALSHYFIEDKMFDASIFPKPQNQTTLGIVRLIER